MTRLVFVGAQGTGKTTILNMFRDRGVNAITEVVRRMVKEKGIQINQAGTAETQQLVFNEYKRLLSEKKDYVSDRGLFDVIGYSMQQCQYENDDMINEYGRELEELKQFIADNPDIIYVYFPIEFAVVDDGVRSTDENYRRDIDDNIHSLCDFYLPDYLTVHGTPEDRFAQIMDWIGPNSFVL